MSRLVLVLSLLAAVSGLYAQEEGEPVTAASVGLSSRRVFRAVEQAGAGATGSFQLARQGWRFGAEISQPFDGDEPGEAYLHTAFAWRPAKLLQLEAGASGRWISEVPVGATKQAFEAGLTAKWALPNGFAVELAGFHDLRLKADTLQVTVNYSMPLKNLGTYLEWSASVGTASARDLLPAAPGPPVGDSYSYYYASVRLPYRIGPQTTLIAGLHFSESVGQSRFWSPVLARGGARGWVELGLSFDF